VQPHLPGGLPAPSSNAYDSAALAHDQWYMVSRKHIRSCDSEKPFEEFRTMYEQGSLTCLNLNEEQILSGGLDKYWILSHRWIDPTHPDPDCHKLKKLKEMLREHPDIEGVWLDYPCLPQGSKQGGRDKDAAEKDFFSFSLNNVNLITCLPPHAVRSLPGAAQTHGERHCA